MWFCFFKSWYKLRGRESLETVKATQHAFVYQSLPVTCLNFSTFTAVKSNVLNPVCISDRLEDVICKCVQ